MLKKSLFLLVVLLPVSSYSQQLDHVLGDLLVQFATDRVGVDEFSKEWRLHNQIITDLKVIRCLDKSSNIWLLQFDFTKVNENHFLEAIKKHSAVLNAQFNHLIRLRKEPNDPNFLNQWQYLNDGRFGGIPNSDIDADLAWDITTGGVTPAGDTIVIAVLDDGMDIRHEDFGDNLWLNHQEVPDNGVDDDNNGFVDDYLGWDVNEQTDEITAGGDHGTIVASVIGAKGNNGIGVTGINWNVKIMTISPFGVGSDDEASAIEGYSYALTMRQLYNDTDGKQGAFVVATNSSWGIDGGRPEEAPIWCSFYETLGEAGIINFAATSNQAINVDIEGDLPTTCPSDFLIGVTSTDRNDNLFYSAGFGKQHIDLGAPGDSIFITYKDNTYGFEFGTSFATPLVAGTVGLLYAAPCSNFSATAKTQPAVAARLVRNYLLNGVDVNSNLQAVTASGGRLNAHNSLQLLLDNCGTCPAPALAETANPLDTSITLDWVNTSEAIQFSQIRYRVAGTEEWQVQENIAPPFLLTDLSACTTYEYQLASNCDNTELTEGPLKSFSTEGCCAPPINLQLAEEGETTAKIAWESIIAAKGYELMIESENGVSVLNASSTSFNLSNLKPCTNYALSVRPLCDRTTVFSEVITLSTKGCGACTDLAYCEGGGAGTFEWIERVELNDLFNESGSDEGYGNYTDIGTILTANETYDITLTAGFDAEVFDEYFNVWIDFNQDGDFDNDSEMVFDPLELTANGAIAGTIAIPSDVPSGVTRMRVAMQFLEDFLAVNPNACSIYEFGEVEDYCVIIEEMATSASNLSTDIQWSVAPNPFHQQFSVALDVKETEAIKLLLHDTQGQLIYQQRLTELLQLKTYTIVINTLPKGVYLLTLYTQKGMATKRLVAI